MVKALVIHCTCTLYSGIQRKTRTDSGFLLYRQRLCIHVTLKNVLYSSAAKAAVIEIKIGLLTLLSVLMLLQFTGFAYLTLI